LTGISFSLGQSGSEFEVIQTGQITALRKSKPGDLRLIEQFEKHLAAQSRPLGGLKTPQILSEFTDFGYLMELVHAVPLGQALNRMTLNQVEELSIKLATYFSSIWSESSKPDANMADLFSRKIVSMRDYAAQHGNSSFVHAIDLLTKHRELGLVAEGWNHGDFSYENILIPQNSEDTEIYIVDFLDSPFQSPLLDFGRFWLDLNYGWWGNKFAPSSAWAINNRILRENFVDLIGKLKVPSKSISYFTLFASLRILPYTKSPVRIAHLKSSISDIIKRSEEWQY
jgi:hypothetical protein